MLVEQVAAKMLAKSVVIQAWMSHFVLAHIDRGEGQIDEAVAALDEALVLADALLEPELAPR
jgi:hypothetical protein